jgi:nitroimidazol reductase NimA-like FMN-containing flavoprotein (pyridoxamine 5'-phosphate oxidase superfamily)
VHAILDAGYVCHIAFTVDGQPHCIPTAHWRVDETLYIHGSNGSRLLRALGEGASACVGVTLVDGLVLARSIFHHSMNYRSAMIYGKFLPVTDEAEKWAAFEAFAEKVGPGRWAQARQPNKQEYAATTLLALPIEQAVAKVRQGPPIDDEADLTIPVWAGVVPFATGLAEPIQDHAHLAASAAM